VPGVAAALSGAVAGVGGLGGCRGGATDELEDRVNPNEASAASLSRLPGIGLKKAQAVVEYRERCRAEQGDETLPFRCCDDLTQVKGIGPATAERMRPYLRFER